MWLWGKYLNSDGRTLKGNSYAFLAATVYREAFTAQKLVGLGSAVLTIIVFNR
jgi:ABC-type sugar transport system permease subunit